MASLFSLLGDITQKGYEKKKAKLLASYIQHLPSNTNTFAAFLFLFMECFVFHKPLSFFEKLQKLIKTCLKVAGLFTDTDTDVSILYFDSLCSVCLGEFLAFCSTLVANIGITSVIL